MKRFVIILMALCSVLGASAQSQYISNSRIDSLDAIGSLDGRRGILILSKSENLVISVTNTKDFDVKPKGLAPDGYNHYEVTVGPDVTNPKVEVNIRGDVNITSFVAKPKKNLFVAYSVDLVATPIDLQDQSGVAAVLDAKLCEVDFTSPFPNLEVKCSDRLGATITTINRASDKTVFVTKVQIPVANIEAAKERFSAATEAYSKYNKWLMTQPDDKLQDADYEKNDKLQQDMENAQKEYGETMHLYISSVGTNTLSVPLDDMAPRVKKSYGVLVLNKVKKVYVSDCSAAMAEGARLFDLREYAGAKASFNKALNSPDTPVDLKASIQTQIDQCDSCDYYQKLAVGSLIQIKNLKNAGTVTQNDVAKYGAAAAEFMRCVYKYNPQNYYRERIERIEKLIENMPLQLKITIRKWAQTYQGYVEANGLGNVEAWAYYGNHNFLAKEYATDKKFTKLIGASTEFKKIGVSDTEGEINLELTRKELPKAIFFRPVGYNNTIAIEYKDVSDIMLQSVGDYNKRQFRIKMYQINRDLKY
ncbi:MAG: hypothetical protein SPD86_09645 [Prevotella sp.]|nr:hypothetical protein [Prevotella sp.]